MKSSGAEISTFISFLEIYQEHVRDLGKAVSRLQDTGVSSMCRSTLWESYSHCLHERSSVKGILHTIIDRDVNIGLPQRG
jgi:hypothetical protein